MRKIYLITCLSFAASSSFAQQKTSLFGAQELKKKPAFIETVNTATIVNGTEDRGSFFWTENFGTGFTGTNGTWTVGAADGNIWKYSLFAPAGCYSLNTPTPATSTASNGFMLFDADS